MNSAANALQVAAVFFLFGYSFITPDDRSKQLPLNTTGVKELKQEDKEDSQFSTYQLMNAYLFGIAVEKSSQPLYLHATISSGIFNTRKTSHEELPVALKKFETIQEEKNNNSLVKDKALSDD